MACPNIIVLNIISSVFHSDCGTFEDLSYFQSPRTASDHLKEPWDTGGPAPS